MAAEVETGNFFMVLEQVYWGGFIWTGRAAFVDTSGQAVSSIACCSLRMNVHDLLQSVTG